MDTFAADLHAATRFRRPCRDPVECFDIPHPALPEGLDGLTILHITDLHVRRFRAGRERFRRMLDAIDDVEPDLVAITGDLMDDPGHEEAALRTLEAIAGVLHPRLGGGAGGACGVFGNHDTPDLRRRLRERLPQIRWLDDSSGQPFWTDFTHNSTPFRVLGLSWPEDALGAALAAPLNGLFTLTLAHYPSALIPCAAIGLPLILAGHTHAGQVRFSARLAPHTSSDIPPHLATGVLRLGSTLACISRGLGEGVLENIRVNCPWQAPLYTLRRGPLPTPARNGSIEHVTQVVAW